MRRHGRPRRSRRLLCALAATAAVLALAAGCSDDGQPDAAAEATPTPHEEPTPPRSQPESRAETEAIEGPRTEVEIRIAEIIIEFDGQVTDDGTLLTIEEPILFDFDSAELKPTATDALDDIAEVLAFYPDAPVQVVGHTDSRGSESYNLDLSQRRADAVTAALIDRGTDRARIASEGRGQAEPVAPNTHPDGSDNPEGRAQNRRVEVLIVGVTPPDTDH